MLAIVTRNEQSVMAVVEDGYAITATDVGAGIAQPVSWGLDDSKVVQVLFNPPIFSLVEENGVYGVSATMNPIGTVVNSGLSYENAINYAITMNHHNKIEIVELEDWNEFMSNNNED